MPGPDDPTAGLQPSFLPWGGHGVAVPAGRPVPRHAAAAVPGDRDQRDVDRRLGGELHALPRPAAPGGVGLVARGARHGRVLALALAALRRRDVLGRDPRPQPRAGPDLRRAGRGRRRAQARRPAHRRAAPASDVAVLVSAESRWAMEFVGPLRGPDAGVDGRPAVLRADPRRVLPRAVRRRARGGHRRAATSCPTTPREVAGAGRCSSCPGSTSPTTRCWSGCAATRRPAGTSCSPRARATPTRRASPATRSCRACCARRPARTTSSTRTSRSPCRSRAPRGSPARRPAWADGLVPEGATVLARYEHPHLEAFAAVDDERPRRAAASPTSAPCPTGALARVAGRVAGRDVAARGPVAAAVRVVADLHVRRSPPTAACCGSSTTGAGSPPSWRCRRAARDVLSGAAPRRARRSRWGRGTCACSPSGPRRGAPRSRRACAW